MAQKSFDLSKFRKSITKSIPGLSIGFHDPEIWLSTGNYALNYLISSDFNKGVPLGKVTMFAGESGCLPESATVRIQTINSEGSEFSTVTVGTLKEIYQSKKYDTVKISTPDDYQKITEWFDKGTLRMTSVEVASGLKTRCAINHLLQRSDWEWVPAGDVKIGDTLITVNSTEDRVVEVYDSDTDEECYDFTVDHTNHRYWGDGFSSHNSGKSYICSANIVKDAQAKDIFVVLIDSENALDESWLHALGVDTSPDKMLKLNMAMIDDVAKTISEFMLEYKAMDEADRPKVLFVIDSLGMLLTPTDAKQFADGDLKGDMGRKAKALTALIRNCVNMFGNLNAGLVVTNHTYSSNDVFSPDDKIAGGNMAIFASSIVVAMNKRKLKEDAEGNKVSEVFGIRSACKVFKSRYSKPFENIEVKIPYDKGMSKYSGLFEFFEKKKLLSKSGNSYVYTTADGSELKYFRKAWDANTNGCLDILMKEFMEKEPDVIEPVDDDDDSAFEDIIDEDTELLEEEELDVE
jgi:RecA/RadA recombinase